VRAGHEPDYCSLCLLPISSVAIFPEDCIPMTSTDIVRLSRAAAVRVAVSIVVLVPCFWQTRIQAGDLSSHLYNAWLVQLIERGQAPGLSLAKQSNNILFDLVLSQMLSAFGPGPAQHIAVSGAVLIFFWGAFAYVRSCARPCRRKAPWHLVICLAMLAYGWVFHMGLFNFYISLGLSFGALALACRRRWWGMTAAVPLLAFAYVAHALPVGWAAGALMYGWIGRRLAPRHRWWLLAGALLSLGGVAFILCSRYGGEWATGQWSALSGAEQTWVFGVHYIPITVALLGLWTLWFQRVLERRGTARTVLDIRFQLCLLSAASVVIIPGSVLLPGMHHTLNVMAERMSLATAVMFCGVSASLRPRRGEIVALAAIAGVFFGFLYTDERALNTLESQMAGLVSKIPPGQRVISTLAEPNSRVNSLAHLIDRVCVRRCFSYANYEPSTAQFRIRADRENGIVVWQYAQSWGIQAGGYVVEPRDLPLYNIDVCDPKGRSLCITSVQSGATLEDTWLPVAPVLGKWDHRAAAP
jgi:hypothetical protein